jgi:hypothetical protein
VTTVPGDLANEPSSLVPRPAGIFLPWLALANEVGPACTP